MANAQRLAAEMDERERKAAAGLLEQLTPYVRKQLGGSVHYATPERCDELIRLVVRHWPHNHLDAAAKISRHHKGIDHAMLLTRAQVREQWEARHGIGPLWQMMLGGTVTAISHVLLELWFQDERWRESLRVLSIKIAEGNATE